MTRIPLVDVHENYTNNDTTLYLNSFYSKKNSFTAQTNTDGLSDLKLSMKNAVNKVPPFLREERAANSATWEGRLEKGSHCKVCAAIVRFVTLSQQ